MTLAKGLAAGLPVARLADRFPPSPEEGTKIKKAGPFRADYLILLADYVSNTEYTLNVIHEGLIFCFLKTG